MVVIGVSYEWVVLLQDEKTIWLWLDWVKRSLEEKLDGVHDKFCGVYRSVGSFQLTDILWLDGVDSRFSPLQERQRFL